MVRIERNRRRILKEQNNIHIRNVILYFLKKHLDMEQHEYFYRNNHGVSFDFRYYYVLVGQELLHLYLRAQNGHVWNGRHA